MKRLYCIYDRVAASFVGQVVNDHADAPVIRNFHDLLGDSRTELAKHAADYELRYIGQITMEGLILPCDPQVVATGAAWLSARIPQDLKLEA